MNNDNPRLLFNRYLNGLTTEEENQKLARLLQDSSAENEILTLMFEAWQQSQPDAKTFDPEESKKILKNILKRSDSSAVKLAKRKRSLIWLVAAATTVIYLAIGLLFFLPNNEQEELAQAPAADKQNAEINKAFLTLSNGEVIILDKTKPGLIKTEGYTSIVKADNNRVSYHTKEKTGASTTAYHTLRTPRGGQYHLVLSDGTNVWLNADSSIEFPIEFNEVSRRVRIEGEVFFDVNKVASGKRKIPFIVTTPTLSIEVLGTEFNVNAYKEEAATKTTLIEGSVIVKTDEMSSLLSPGQEASVGATSNQIQITKGDPDQALAWKNGYFYFKNSTIEEIMQQLSKWYDVAVRFEGPAIKKQFSGEIPRSASLLQVLEILEVSQVRPKIIDDEIVITN